MASTHRTRSGPTVVPPATQRRNSQGTAVGWSDVVLQWKNHAFASASSNDIGTLDGQGRYATGINEKGQVVG
jgi:hypothetical protein